MQTNVTDCAAPPAALAEPTPTVDPARAASDALRLERLGPNLAKDPPGRGALLFREFITMNGLTQSDMAHLIKMTRAAINRWWKGETHPRFPVAIKMEAITDGFVRVSDWYSSEEINAMAQRQLTMAAMRLRIKDLQTPRKRAATPSSKKTRVLRSKKGRSS